MEVQMYEKHPTGQHGGRDTSGDNQVWCPRPEEGRSNSRTHITARATTCLYELAGASRLHRANTARTRLASASVAHGFFMEETLLHRTTTRARGPARRHQPTAPQPAADPDGDERSAPVATLALAPPVATLALSARSYAGARTRRASGTTWVVCLCPCLLGTAVLLLVTLLSLAAYQSSRFLSATHSMCHRPQSDAAKPARASRARLRRSGARYSA